MPESSCSSSGVSLRHIGARGQAMFDVIFQVFQPTFYRRPSKYDVLSDRKALSKRKPVTELRALRECAIIG